MTKPIFLSHFLAESTPGYGGSVGVKIRHVSKIAEGASSNSQEWTISNHIGTHIDLPAHFDDRGQRLETFKAEDWVFNRPFLLEINSGEGEILEVDSVFNSIPLDADFLIIKTGFQKHRGQDLYWQNNPGLSPELGQWLRKERPSLRCMGFDFISITSYSNRPLGRVAHKSFLGVDDVTKPLRVIEDMNLADLKTTPKQVVVAPLMVGNADGTQVTVLAFT